MTKHTQYVCQQCGYSQVGWAGKCPECGSWGSLVETVVSVESGSKKGKDRQKNLNKPIELSKVPFVKTSRLSTKLAELDRVLGGGLVPGQVILIAGEPGIGKSTLLLQISENLGKVIYVSGEESNQQIKIRAERLGVKNKNILLLEETNVDSILETISDSAKGQQPLAIIIDSIQTMVTRDLRGSAGSVGQVRESAFRLTQLAKSKSIPLFLVGHVTKEGSVSGPATLTHMVDTLLWFEGDKDLFLRMLRSVKNRFGPTDEIGIFEMQEKGLVSVEDVEKLFIASEKKVAGKAIASILEGTRPVLVEIQSLVGPSSTAFPKRIAQGIDSRRLEVIIAVLSRHANLPLYEKDVFINVVGGIIIKEPASDLAVSLAIASSFLGKPLPPRLTAIGEVGLLGEVRSVLNEEKRIRHAKRQGFAPIVTSRDFHFISEAIKSLLR